MPKKKAKSEVEGVTCPWCPYNNHGCNKEDCDFQNLPYEKEAILTRIKEERARIEDMKESISEMVEMPEAEDAMATAVDVTKGIQIMMSRLQADFGMSLDDVKKVVGDEKSTGFGQRVRLMAALAKMKRKRGKQQNGK